jgi:hypothetical protein
MKNYHQILTKIRMHGPLIFVNQGVPQLGIPHVGILEPLTFVNGKGIPPGWGFSTQSLWNTRMQIDFHVKWPLLL